jgi:peptidoglycan/LPS O-acetylase OafA/YrhL
LPGLFLTAFWDRLGLSLLPSSLIYAGRVPGLFMNYRVEDCSGATTLVGNVLFLQTTAVSCYGSNAALWSLANEFWYYLLFPLICLAVLGKRSWLARAASAAAAALLLATLGTHITRYFTVWLLGALVPFLPRCSGRALPRLSLFAVTAFLGSVLLPRLVSPSQPLLLDLILGCGTALLLYAILSSPPEVPGRFYASAANLLAGCSYTLYLVHLPLLVFLSASLSDGARWAPDIRSLGWFGLVCAISFLYAFGISQLTEKHTGSIRRRMETWYRVMRSRPADGAYPSVQKT